MRRAAANVAILVLTLAACELLLTLAARASPRLAYLVSPPWRRVEVPDPALGFRLSPYYPGHDSRGYRNEQVPERVDVLAIGDSFTYGFGAMPDGTWPRALEALTELSVYNAGVGHYGPCEYHVEVEQLLGFKPGLVIVAVHTGNDYSDAYRAVYVERRCSAYRSSDAAVLAAMRAADARATLAELAYRHGWDRAPELPPYPLGLQAVRRWLSDHSALYGLLRELRSRLRRLNDALPGFPEAPFAEAVARPLRVAYAGPAAPRTVFKNPDLFALTVDRNDPRIREGGRVTKAMLLSIRRRLRQEGIEMLVVIILDKPAVYAPLIQACDASSMPPAFFRLAAMEEALAADLRGFLAANDIPAVETTAALRDYLRAGLRVYPQSDDHHANSLGYRAIAEAIAGHLDPGGGHSTNLASADASCGEQHSLVR